MNSGANEGETGGDGQVAALAVASAPPLRLSGEATHRVDRKGRLVLPAGFRPHFTAGGHLQSWQNDSCLTLFTADGWERWVAFNRAQATSGASAANATSVMRRIYRAAELVVPDAQGRFIMPIRFRELAPLDTEVAIVGALDRLEIWLPDALEADDPAAGNVIEINQDSYENYPR